MTKVRKKQTMPVAKKKRLEEKYKIEKIIRLLATPFRFGHKPVRQRRRKTNAVLGKRETTRRKTITKPETGVCSPPRLDFGYKKRQTKVCLFLPQIYHELNLLMLMVCSNIYQ